MNIDVSFSALLIFLLGVDMLTCLHRSFLSLPVKMCCNCGWKSFIVCVSFAVIRCSVMEIGSEFKNPVLHVVVVAFHHKKGCQVM